MIKINIRPVNFRSMNARKMRVRLDVRFYARLNF